MTILPILNLKNVAVGNILQRQCTSLSRFKHKYINAGVLADLDPPNLQIR